MADMQRVIVVNEDGTATYERRAVVPSANGEPPRTRVMETKRVAADSLIPPQGEFVLQPPGTRFFREEEGITVLVIEEPPAVRTVNWITSSPIYESMRRRLGASGAHHLWGEDPRAFEERLRTQRTFTLAFPYLVKCYRIRGTTLEGMYLWYRVRPFKGERDDLLVPNVPNRAYQNINAPEATVCLPDRARGRTSSSLISVVEETERDFWGSPWNDHWTEEFFAYAGHIPELASPWEWERQTKLDPLFILRLPWRSRERTIGQEIRRIFRHTGPTREKVFTYFMGRVQAADPWDAPPKPTEAPVAVSPAEHLYLGNLLISVGDLVERVDQSFDDLPRGMQRIIEWFGRDDGTGSRLVKLEGVAEPLPLICEGKLSRFVRLVPKPQPAITVAGVPVTTGTFLRITDPRAWGRPCAYYEIQQVRRGERGAILVTMKGEQFATVIGEGETLFPGLALCPPEEKDDQGYLRADTFTLPDGTVIRRGDEFYFECQNHGFERVRVAAFFALSGGQRGRLFRTTNGEDVRFEDNEGRLAAELVPVARLPQPKVVRVGKAVARLGDQVRFGRGTYRVRAFSPRLPDGRQLVQIEDGNWQLFTQEGRLAANWELLPKLEVVRNERVRLGEEEWSTGWYWNQENGTLERVTHFVNNEPGSVLAETEAGTTVAFVSDWKRNEKLVPVLVRCAVRRDLVLRRGMRLRLREAVKDVPALKRFLVSHIVPAKDKKPAVVVLTTGVGFELTPANTALFEVRKKNQWAPLGTAPGTFEETSGKPGDNLVVGARVRYLGGDTATRFKDHGTEELAKATPAVLIEDRRGHWLCKFDGAFPGCHDEKGRFEEDRYQWIYPQYLALWGSVSVKQTGFTRVFTQRRRDKDIRSRCVNVGQVVGKDRGGREVRVGDRVRVCDQNGLSVANEVPDRVKTRLSELVRAGHTFTVVHWGFSAECWLYLDSGENLNQLPRFDVVGANEIPQEYYGDQSWWQSLAWARLSVCDRVEASGAEDTLPVAEDQDGNPIRVGDQVQVWSDCICRGDVVGGHAIATQKACLYVRNSCHTCTVVHWGLDKNGEKWLYLDTGQDVGQKPRTDLPGFDSIPVELRGDPTWWKSLCLVQANICQLVK